MEEVAKAPQLEALEAQKIRAHPLAGEYDVINVGGRATNPG